MAHFEIYILNFNGGHFLETCLTSLSALEHGKHTVTVNVVDNGSSDNSRHLVNSRFPSVNFIPLNANLGFSRGNNAGVRIRTEALKQEGRAADFHVFLNNDTAVDPHWLLGAAAVFERDSKVGLVGSKSIFFDRFVVLDIETSPAFVPTQYGSSDTRSLGVVLEEDVHGEGSMRASARFKFRGAYGREGGSRWLSSHATIYVPMHDTAPETTLAVKLRNAHAGALKQTVKISVANDVSEKSARYHLVEIPAKETVTFKVPVEPCDFLNVIQNAGSFVNKKWEAGDIGFLEVDRGQREGEHEVAAICGVSMFIRAPLFEELGGFEQHSFAYYEDTDLSVRARLKGWRCIYTSASTLRHVHCGSGVEHSDYFNTNVAYSRLLFASKVMPSGQWRALMRDYWKAFKQEFATYEYDRCIENKPFLRAIGRYLKHPIAFMRNRLHARFSNPQRRLASVLSD